MNNQQNGGQQQGFGQQKGGGAQQGVGKQASDKNINNKDKVKQTKSDDMGKGGSCGT